MADEEGETGVNVLGDETESEETEENEGQEEEEWIPPTKAEFEKLKRRLNRANNEAKKAKDAATGKPSEDDVEATKEAVRKEEADKYKSRIVKSEAKALLKDAGAKGDPAKLIRLINIDDIDLGDDDEIEGLDAEIDILKTDYPELFEPAKIKADPRTKKDAAEQKVASSGETWEEKMAKAMRG